MMVDHKGDSSYFYEVQTKTYLLLGNKKKGEEL